MAAFIRHAEENKVIKSERVFPFLRDTGAITGQRNLRGALCAHNGEEKGNSGGKKRSRRERQRQRKKQERRCYLRQGHNVNWQHQSDNREGIGAAAPADKGEQQRWDGGINAGKWG